MWVQSRQYTGRIVTVTNAKIFDEPVYNYTRDLPFLREEMHIPISYNDDHDIVEQILLEAARKETVQIEEIAESTMRRMEEAFSIHRADIAPRVFIRLNGNWVEMTVRFVCEDHDMRGLKDRMSREIKARLAAAKIGIASGTYEIVGLPPVRVPVEPPTGKAS